MTSQMVEPAVRSTETTTRIEASPEAVWKALTEPSEIVRWFALEAESEPGPDGSVTWRWGDAYLWPTRIAIWEPGRHLRLTYVQEGTSEEKRTRAALPGEEAEELVVDFHLEGAGGATWLRVVHSGFGRDASWDDEYEGVRRGWIGEIASLRHYLERHAGEDRGVWWTFVKSDVPRAEAFARLIGGKKEPPLVEQNGDALTLGAGDAGPVGLELLRMEGPGELFARVPAWDDALFRIWIEPQRGGSSISVFLSLYGEGRARAGALAGSLAASLRRLFPEHPDGWTVLEG